MTLPVDVSFAKSCGQVSPLSLKVTSVKGDKTAKIVVNKPFAFIGSNLHCDVNLPNPAVSKRHVYLQLIGGRLYCIDQASREGIFWGERQRLFGWLDLGQSLRVGPYEVMLVEGAGAEDCSAREATNQGPILVEAEKPELPQASVQINETLIFPLHRQLTIIGSSKYCHLELDHQDVSRVHASLLRTHDGKHWIIDLMSRTGVKVNGIRCQVSPLKDGDVIKIGNYSTSFKLKSLVLSETSPQPVVEVSVPTQAVVKKSEDEAPAEPFLPPAVQELPTLAEIEPVKQAPSPAVPVPLPPLVSLSPCSLVPEPPKEIATSASAPADPPPAPAKEGELIGPNSGSLVPTREGRLRKRKRRPVRAQLAHSPAEMQLVTTILQQMQQMQQEMFHQVRMSMEMVSDHVEKMQANQRESVRQELTELRQLSQELVALKEQLNRPAANVRSIVSHVSSLAKGRMRGIPSVSPVRVATVSRRLRSEAPPSRTSPQIDEQERTEAVAAEVLGLQPTPAPAKETFEPDPIIEPAGAHSHAWITQRVASLEKERQSRWQRIVAKIIGR